MNHTDAGILMVGRGSVDERFIGNCTFLLQFSENPRLFYTIKNAIILFYLGNPCPTWNVLFQYFYDFNIYIIILQEFILVTRNQNSEKEMTTHSSVLAWRIPGTGEPGGLPFMGSHRVGHD